MAIYRGSVKTAGIGRSFNPGNLGCEGQVLTRTQCGYEYCDIPEELPSGGTEGQVLTKTASGEAWCDSQGGNSGPMVDVLVVGGGGSGGSGKSSYGGGGGGGGGVCIECKYKIEGDEYCVIVGAGGEKPTNVNASGNNGGDSCFGNLIGGGGGGGGAGVTSNNYCGCNGCNSEFGSGGGAGNGCCGMGKFGAGFQSSGGGNPYSGISNSGLPGGGVGGNGYGLIACGQQIWGAPKYINFDGVAKCISCGGRGGGGGSGCTFNGCNATMYGGGGNGGYNSSSSGQCGGAGCQGIVIVRYPTDGSYGINSATGGTITTCTIRGVEYNIHTFTSDGTFCITG